MIYLDYQATTPLAPEVAAAMAPWTQEKFANPHAPSRWGHEAAAAIEVARKQVAAAIFPSVRVERSRDTAMPRPAEASLDDARDERTEGSLAFTGSATEALNWALKGTLEQAPPGRTRLVTIATEHAAVLDSCDWLAGRGVEITRLGVGRDGLIDLDQLDAALDDRVALVAAMLVNNEIGVIQPIGEIAAAAHQAGALMLCDAVQGLGRVPMPHGPDLVAVSAHKIHGPKGIGALWMRAGAEPAALIHGGGQERGLRSGTLSPALCVGFGAAAKLAAERRAQDEDFTDCLWRTALAALGPGWTINGSDSRRYRGNLNVRRDGLDAARLIADLRDIAFSLGSACASGSGRPSHVLRALGLTPQQARSSIRLGFGRYTTTRELESACRRITEAADAQQGLAA